MLFNSYIFILTFLPLTLLLFYLLNSFGLHMIAQTVLFLMSLLFYGYFNFKYVFILCLSIIINYLISKLLNNTWIVFHKKFILKCLLFAGIVLNISLIFYFKYYNFFIENITVLFQSAALPLKEIILPLGISFFTFQQISYLVDSYRGQTQSYTFLEYAVFVSFFPQLVAGPIVLHKEMIPQLREVSRKKVNYENLSLGLMLFSTGLFKKVIIADTLGKAVNLGFGLGSHLSSLDGIVVMLSFTFQIYFDFSGYCDMATGIAKMFNLDLPMNFNAPYTSLSIPEFWERWHMSLTRFLREYIYFPLGGNRKGALRCYFNIFIVFLISGIWHGANWTFILWGVIHGIANILTRIFKGYWNKLHVAFQWLTTFAFINITWVFFKSDSVSQAFSILKQTFSFNSLTLSSELVTSFSLTEVTWFFNLIGVGILGRPMVQMAFILFSSLFICLNIKPCITWKHKPTLFTAVYVIFILSWSIFSLSEVSTFLYFNF